MALSRTEATKRLAAVAFDGKCGVLGEPPASPEFCVGCVIVRDCYNFAESHKDVVEGVWGGTVWVPSRDSDEG